jgi:crotonobetainyl-CoA:carnitine CoA-transferase CaiB-like acyl-CoA transferase
MSDHTNILANRMRSATSAAQRKILMQQAQAVNFAVTDQKGQPLKVGDKVKTSRGVTGVITEIVGSRVYVHSADSYDTHQTGEATWVEPADRLVKMQANFALEQPDAEEIAYRTAQAQRQKAVDKAIQATSELQATAARIARFLKVDDIYAAMNHVKEVGKHADILERLINRIPN